LVPNLNKKEYNMTEEPANAGSPLTEPPQEEGNDQEVAEGADIEPVTEDDLTDAPDDPEGAAA
jgi:hypothetical protein